MRETFFNRFTRFVMVAGFVVMMWGAIQIASLFAASAASPAISAAQQTFSQTETTRGARAATAAATAAAETQAGAETTSTTARGGRRGARGPVVGPPPPRDFARSFPHTTTHDLVARLDFDHFKANIKQLASFGTRYWDTAGNEKARDWIAAELTKYGYKPERVKFIPPARGRQGRAAKEVDSIFVTKIGTTRPGEMYIVSAHMDSYNTQAGRGQEFAPGANDDGSGTSLVMEMARIFSSPDVKTDVSIRFCLWNCEEIGLEGAKAYVEQRRGLQGVENPPGSGQYPEPKWLGVIQHDMMMFDHGQTSASLAARQIRDANVNIEYDSAQTSSGLAIILASKLLEANSKYATDYPAAVGGFMQNTDSVPFTPYVPAISLRENERRDQIGRGSDPQWHKNSDVYETYTDADFRLGFNALQMTCGAVADLAGLKPLK